MLVGGQVALAVVLLTVSLFMYRGFSAQLATGPGYRTDHLLMMSFDTSLVRYTDAQSSQFFKEVADRAREVPGVVRVSMMSAAPMSNDVGIEPLIPEGYQFPAGKENASVLSFRIDEHYFDAMGLPLLRGRQFTVDDAADAPKVAIVNEQFAQHYWPNQDPIGKRFRQVRDQSWGRGCRRRKDEQVPVHHGAADRVRLSAVSTGPRPGDGDAAQTSGDPASLAGPLREVARSLDANLPIYNVRTMAELYRMRATSIFHVILATVAGMGLMGLGLAIVGLYSLVSFAAGRRTREIGIRMAIGAEEGHVLRMVLGQGLRLAVVGLAIGLVASAGAGRLLLAAFPTGTNQRDTVALLMVVPIVLAVTFLAAYIPARRASRTSPMQALRKRLRGSGRAAAVVTPSGHEHQ